MTTTTLLPDSRRAQEGVHTLLLVVRDATETALRDDPHMTAVDVLSLMDITLVAARLGAEYATCRHCDRPITRRTPEHRWFHGDEPLAFDPTLVRCHEAGPEGMPGRPAGLAAEDEASPAPGTVHA